MISEILFLVILWITSIFQASNTHLGIEVDHQRSHCHIHTKHWYSCWRNALEIHNLSLLDQYYKTWSLGSGLVKSKPHTILQFCFSLIHIDQTFANYYFFLSFRLMLWQDHLFFITNAQIILSKWKIAWIDHSYSLMYLCGCYSLLKIHWLN